MNSKQINAIIITSLLFLVSVSKSKTDDALVVQLPKGAIRGRFPTSANGSIYYAFQDIPYAAPPIGENRFAVPKSVEPWDGILDATENRKACISTDQTNTFYNKTDVQISTTEDCLYLNVYTPVKPGNNIYLPVYIFIHGGAFQIGNGWYSSYGPKYLMDHNIVVVTLNYRLGVFGFLATTDGVIPGNLGLRDQNFALKWVQKNIHIFGGDPNQVTVGGGSAGSISSGFHLLSRRSEGLFRNIILQSGTAINTIGVQENPDKYAFKLGTILDNTLSFKDSKKLLTILLNATSNEIMSAAATAKVPYDGNVDFVIIKDLIWTPIIESSNLSDTFISDLMYDALQNGRFNRVPILIGFMDEEALSLIKDTPLDVFAQMFDSNPSLMVNDRLHLDIQNRTIVGNELWKLYSGNIPFAEDIGALVKFASDSFMTRGVIRHADATSRYVPTYLYQYSYGGDQQKRFPDTGNAGHAQDMRFIWERTNFPDNTEFDNVIRQRTLKLWTNFIKYQNPTPESDPLLLNTIWPKLNPGNVIYLNINTTFDFGSDPRHYHEIKSIFDKYIIPPLATY